MSDRETKIFVGDEKLNGVHNARHGSFSQFVVRRRIERISGKPIECLLSTHVNLFLNHLFLILAIVVGRLVSLERGFRILDFRFFIFRPYVCEFTILIVCEEDVFDTQGTVQMSQHQYFITLHLNDELIIILPIHS